MDAYRNLILFAVSVWKWLSPASFILTKQSALQLHSLIIFEVERGDESPEA